MTKIFLGILLILLAWQAQGQTLLIATDPSTPPFESIDKDGMVVGFDPDILAALGFVYDGWEYDIISQSWDDVFAGVLNGTFDFAISSITINEEREKIYDFSVPYFVSTHVILAPEGTDIKTAQDLLDKNVAVVTGTTGETAIEGLFGGDSPNIQHFEDLSQAVQALADGTVDAYVDDSGFLENYAKNNAGFIVIKDPNAFAKEFYGLMFPKGSSLVGDFDEGITTILENGEYSDIYETWFGSTPDVDLLLEAGEYENPYEALEGYLGEEDIL